MQKKRRWLWIVCLLAAMPLTGRAATILSQNFDDISTLAGSGWVLVNRSAPAGTSGWFQGNNAIFGSQAGAANSYIGANFNNAGFGGNISNWLILPTLTFDATSTISFYTRTENPALAPDRLEVRLSTNGSSSDVGASDSSVGDFTTLLLSINPTQTNGIYPSDWTQFTLPLGIVLPTTGRLAFRYFVTDTSTNGDYIGIDSVVVTGPIPEPSTIGLCVMGAISVFGACRYRMARK